MASRSLKRLPALPGAADVEVVSAGVVPFDVNGVGSGVVVDIPPVDEAPDVDIRFDPLGFVSLSRIPFLEMFMSSF